MLSFADPVLAAVMFHPRDDPVPQGSVGGRCLVDDVIEMEDDDICCQADHNTGVDQCRGGESVVDTP